MLRLPQDIPSGNFTVRVGLYEPKTELRLDVLDVAGNPAGVSVPLTSLTLHNSTN